MGVLAVFWTAGLLAGCTGGEEGVTYELELVPVVAERNQDPFATVDSHSLQVVGPGNDVYQEMTLTGTQVSLGGLDVMNGDTLTYRGSSNHQVTAYGRTGPVHIADGESLQVPIWIGEVDALGWLADRDDKEGVFQGALTALGDGRYLLFGGEDRTLNGGVDEPSDTISVLDLGEPDADPVFVELGVMPGYDDGGTTVTTRVGATATTLNDVDELGGQVLVAGGTATWGDPNNITGTAFLFDPETGDIEELDNDAWLGVPRFDHVAVQNRQGDVVLFGGMNKVFGGVIAAVTYVDYFDRNERSFQKLGPFNIAAYGAADVLGTTEGVIHCGGLETTDNSWFTSDVCHLAAPNEDIDEIATAMPLDLGHHTVTYLDEGQVLIAGGVSTGEAIVGLGEMVDASSRAWIYDHQARAFEEVDEMAIGRAGHRAIPLSGSRVLVVGGVRMASEVPYGEQNAADPLACGEIFNLSDGSWEPADSCAAGDTSGVLKGRTVWPLVANDPDFGAVIMGGGQDNWSAGTYVGFWTHRN